jgi:hypothetical protein
MDRDLFVANIILSMREFQKENNIRKQCLTNSQYLYDIIKMNSSSNVKTKAVLVFSADDVADVCTFVGGHLVVVLDDETVIDPSYDIFCLKNKSYFDNIKDFMDIFADKVELKTRVDVKKIVSEHISFMKFAEQINNGEHVITENKFYNEQADYIEKVYRDKIQKL